MDIQLRFQDQDDRVHGNIGKIYFAFAPFTIGDRLEELRKPLKKLGFLVSPNLLQLPNAEVIDGFRIKRPARLRIVGKREYNGVLTVQTGGYDGSRKLLEEVIGGLELNTNLVGERMKGEAIKGLITILPAANTITEKILAESKTANFSKVWGAMVYGAFLNYYFGMGVDTSTKRAGRAYNFNFEKAVKSVASDIVRVI